MSQELLYFLSIVAFGICIYLVIYIKKKYSLIHNAKILHQEQDEKAQLRYEEQRSYLIESITIIAKAYGNDDKLTCTEACMRLSTLLQTLAPQLLEKPELSVIKDVHLKTEHIPIKEKWKALSKQEKWTFTKEMALLDQKYQEDVLSAAQYLITYDFKLLVH